MCVRGEGRAVKIFVENGGEYRDKFSLSYVIVN